MLAERIKKWPEQWEERGIQKGRMEGIQQGERIGIQKAKRETARNLIGMNILTDAQIAQASGLTEAEVKALCAEIKH